MKYKKGVKERVKEPSNVLRHIKRAKVSEKSAETFQGEIFPEVLRKVIVIFLISFLLPLFPM